MSWKTENFRSESYRQRALEGRNNGHGKAHGSWAKADAARRQAQVEEQKEWDNFDRYVARVKAMVKTWHYVSPEAQAARDEWADLIYESEKAAIPF